MIRLFLFSRHLPALTRDEFQQGLLHEHAPLVRKCAGFREHTNGYMQNHFSGQVSGQGDRKVVNEPRFDNCSEFWYESIDHILKSYNNDDYFRMLRPDENTRTDSSTRIALIAQESVAFEDASYERAPVQSKLLVLGGESASPGTAEPAGPVDRANGLTVQCLRKTVNTVLGTMDFLRARISDDVLPEFNSITTYSLAKRGPDGAAVPGGRQFDLFGQTQGNREIALLARSHSIFGNAA